MPDLSFGAQLGLGAASSAFSGLGSLFTGGQAYRRQKQLMQQQYGYQQEAATTAYNRQLEFWNKQNAYNTPAASRGRLESAGLNPALMYGGSGSSTPAQGLSSVPMASASGAPSVPRTQLENPIDSMMKLAQIENIKANTAKITGDTIDPGLKSDSLRIANELAAQNVIGADLSNQLKAFDLDFKNTTREVNISKLEQSVSNMKQQYSNMVAQLDLLEQQYSNNPDIMDKVRAQTRLIGAQTGLAEATADLRRSDVAVNSAQIEQIGQSILNMIADNKISAATLESIIIDNGIKMSDAEVRRIAAEYAGTLTRANLGKDYVSIVRDFTIALYGGLKVFGRLMK